MACRSAFGLAGIMEDLRRILGIADVALPDTALAQLTTHFDLLLRWNSRMNLSAIREPEQIAERHFLESIFVARHIPAGVHTLLDFGSGAGFPGLPIAICRPEIRVTLAESQSKKSAFLREVVRVAGISCEVFGERVEKLPADRIFDAVAMRAVDRTEEALPQALARTNKVLLWMTTQEALARSAPAAKMQWDAPIAMPGSRQMSLMVGRK